MLYFAYGSNLDPDQMQARAPDARVVGLGLLRDYRLTFPLRSLRWGGGAAGLTHAHGGMVWGVIYELNASDLAALDAYEGWRGPGDHHNTYDRDLATVELTRPDDGSVPRRVRATTYFARNLNPTPPTREYLDAMLRGARHHRLPPEYIEWMESIEVANEPAPGT